MTHIANRIAPLSLRLLELLVRWTNTDGHLDHRMEMIVPRNRSMPCPLSFAQERLWFLEQLQPGNTAYNLPFVFPFGDPLDTEVLERALNEIVARHEALRTTFTVVGGSPVQRIASNLRIGIEEIDLRSHADRYNEAQRVLNEEVAQAFDLQRGPLLRARLIRRSVGDSLFVVNMHHIVSDGWSGGVLLRELLVLYNAFIQERPSPLEELRIQYPDFAVWQREWLRGETLLHQLSYWKDQMIGAPPLLELPSDRPRPPVESYHGAVQTFSIPRRIVEPLRELGREQNATLFMVLLAVFKAMLSRYSGMTDIVVGSPIANRNRAELESLIGFFVNMLALRTQVPAEVSIADLVGRVREVTLGAYEHQDLPFEKLVEELHPRRSLSHSPIYQVAFVLQNTPDVEQDKATTEVGEPVWKDDPIYNLGTSKFDITLSLAERGSGLIGTCEYRTDLFNHRTTNRFIRRYVQMLEAVAANANTQVWQLPLELPGEVAPVRQQPVVVKPFFLTRIAKFTNTQWDTKTLAVIGLSAATMMKLSSTSCLVVVGNEDLDNYEALWLLGQVAAAAVEAKVWTVAAANLVEANLIDENPTHLLLTPEGLSKLKPEIIPPETTLVVLGLPWFAATVAPWRNRQVIGLWGTWPGTLCCAVLEMEEPEAVIREPVAGCWIEVLDAQMRRQAIDLYGKIYVGGEGLSLQAGEVEDPFAPQERLYWTGWIGRRRADGRIEVMGNKSRIVSLDGMRVDPGRLEALLKQHPALQQAAVWVQGEESDPWLVAWVVPLAGRNVREEELMDYVGERVCAGLLPRQIVIVDELPTMGSEVLSTPTLMIEAPRTPVEAVIARIWHEVLKRPQMDVNANFFDLGGNSVNSVQVISRIRNTLHVDLMLHRLFEAPTIAELAHLVETDPQFSSLKLEDLDDAKVEPALQRTFSMLDIQMDGLKEQEILDLVDTLEDWEVDELLLQTI